MYVSCDEEEDDDDVDGDIIHTCSSDEQMKTGEVTLENPSMYSDQRREL